MFPEKPPADLPDPGKIPDTISHRPKKGKVQGRQERRRQVSDHMLQLENKLFPSGHN